MANYMADVAKLLGVEIGEEFEIQFDSPYHASAMFTKDMFKITDTDAPITIPYWPESILHSLLRGRLTIKRKAWKPKVDERYYTVAENGVPEQNVCVWDFIDISLYKLGNCYRTKEEAEANRDKWSRFYASDEVLEV